MLRPGDLQSQRHDDLRDTLPIESPTNAHLELLKRLRV